MSQTQQKNRVAEASLIDARARSARLEAAFLEDPGRFRVLTGDRPTGPLHLGHYFGTLLNRVRLQNLGVQTIVLVADYQTITDRDSPSSLPMTSRSWWPTTWRSASIPSRDDLRPLTDSRAQSADGAVPEPGERPELARNPTVKEERAASGLQAASGLLFTYPVHQAADILFCHGNVVPVGKDQLPHLEMTRVIARRFNQRYSPPKPFFPEPEALLSEAPLLLGTDGQKMSKSRTTRSPSAPPRTRPPG